MRKHPWVEMTEEQRYAMWSTYFEYDGKMNYSEFCDYMDERSRA